jgi:hypothetical protein
MKTVGRVLSAGLLLLVTVLMSAAVTFAEWRVEFESKEVPAGATDVTIDVTAFWDLNMSGFVVPVVVRTKEGGAFWKGELPFDTGGNGFWHPYAHGVQWKWATPWATLIEEFLPPRRAFAFDPCDPPSDLLYNGMTPDQFVLIAHTTTMPNPAEPMGRVVLTFSFDVGDTGGVIEFDTACMSENLRRISMIDDDFPPIEHGFGPSGTGEVTFGKGTVTILKDIDGDGIYDHLDNCPMVYNPGQEDDNQNGIGDACEGQICNCEHHGDVNGDGDWDMVDIAWMVEYALRMLGPAPPIDPDCPHVNRADWDCNGIINLLDVVKMVNYVFHYPAPGPCDPCECAPYPDNCPTFP